MKNNSNKNLYIFITIHLCVNFLISILSKTINLPKEGDITLLLITFFTYLIFSTLPVILYLKFIDKINPIDYVKGSSTMLSGIFKGVLISAFIFLVLFLKNNFIINLAVNYYILIGRALVTPFEEITFRGFYLNKLSESMSFTKASIISSIIFASVHIPNLFNGETLNFIPLMQIFIVGIWLSYIYKKTNSLMASILSHATYNICLLILF
ncbi:lysostaphin resistance A-like protein [Clostridium sp.]|uniref:lysostaphin resistance A-like protein n=1 Tax=Clostridium sp. TaxID=1506 RepID=UPI003463DEB8